MTLKDKLEIGLKEDAPFRKDNLPEAQVRGPEVESGRGRSPGVPASRGDGNIVADSNRIDTTKQHDDSANEKPGEAAT